VRSYLVPLDEAGELPDEGTADLRYAGQSFELSVPLQHDLSAAFHRAHEELYGFAERDRPIELVAVRTAELTRGPHIELRVGAARTVEGPHVLELPGATVWVPDGWAGRSDTTGTLVLRREPE
jgi:N-methylhydantoinase A/oxoprolinase/acetone carboxylase beta subunit